MPEAEIEIREKKIGARFDILRQDPSDEAKVLKLVEMAAKASEGESATEDLLEALVHPDASIRYWGATGLGNTGSAAGAEAESALRRVLNDESPNVRIAAARGLCRMGRCIVGLPILERELASEHQWGRLAAAIALDELDEAARPALRALQAALVDQPNKYIVRVANRAVNELMGTNNQVR